MSYLISILLIALTAVCFIGLPYLLVSDHRMRQRENPVFDALVARIKDSDALTRDELVMLHDETLDWHKRTGLYGSDVGRYLSYLRGRIGIKPL